MEEYFQRGDLILTSKPFVYILNNNERGVRCDHCLKRNADLRPCAKCKFVYFCDKDCEIRAWKMHKSECDYIKHLPSDTSVDDLLFMARVVFRLEDPEALEEYEMVGPHRRNYESLQSHSSQIKNNPFRFMQFWFRYEDIQKFIRDKCPSQEVLLEIYGKILINSFFITDEETRELVGRGLYFGASLLDHSCVPDCVYVFEGNVLSVRAIKDIPHRDYKRIYLSYVNPRGTIAARKVELSQYYFTCMCPLCTDPHSDAIRTRVLDSSRANSVITHTNKIFEVLCQMNNEGEDCSKRLEVAKSCLEMQEGVLPDTNELRLDLLFYTATLCVNLKRWTEAAQLAVKTLDPLRIFYGDFSPQLASRLLQVARIQAKAGDAESSCHSYSQAEKVAEVVFGIQHPLYHTIHFELEQLNEQHTPKIEEKKDSGT